MITGIVNDDYGIPVSDATVTLWEGPTEIAGMRTDSVGKFHFELDVKYQGHLLLAKASKTGFDAGESKFREGDGQEVKLQIKALKPVPTPRPVPVPPTPTPGPIPPLPPPRKPMTGLVALMVSLAVLAVASVLIWHLASKTQVPGWPTGTTVEKATNMLQIAGLGWAITTQVGSNEPGTVLNIEPAAGTAVSRHSQVVLTVDPGVQVPPVIDKSLQEAKRELLDAGLSPSVSPAAGPSSVKPGSIWKADPAPDTFVKAHSNVELFEQTGRSSGTPTGGGGAPAQITTSSFVGTWACTDAKPYFGRLLIKKPDQSGRLAVNFENVIVKGLPTSEWGVPEGTPPSLLITAVTAEMTFHLTLTIGVNGALTGLYQEVITKTGRALSPVTLHFNKA